MRLTNSIRNAFVKSVMDDTPSIDYAGLMQKEADRIGRATMPPEIAAVYDKHPDWFSTQWVSIGKWYGCGPFPVRNARYTAADVQIMNRLVMLRNEQDLAREQLRGQLKNAVAGVTTTKALAEMFPEFAKYLPKDAPKACNLPALTNVVAEFVKAGWPKSQPA